MLTLKGYITESKVSFNGNSIIVTKPSRAKGWVMVDINVKEFDKAFRKETDMYIGKGGKNQIKGRYDRIGFYIMGGSEKITDEFDIDYEPAEHMEASEVSVTLDGRISFLNGRHRYAWLRDHGANTIPVMMDVNSVYNAKKLKYIR